ncbi:2-amino-4-hydroxy-6-hydroxymethyldihydropteridine diphosphokinase [bacterium]|nr:2-amino-4-hydroxy-6-hydroxymethyldihydropteridine diphosphokinase [bacterium]
MSEECVFVSLGSNLGDSWGYIRRATALVAAMPGVRLTGRSPLRRTKPVGLTTQPDFVNRVLRLSCETGPERLLSGLLAVELRLGRQRRVRWGPRTIDLDILFYGDLVRSGETLTLPHPEVWNRPFFLELISTLDPQFLRRWPQYRPQAGQRQ